MFDKIIDISKYEKTKKIGPSNEIILIREKESHKNYIAKTIIKYSSDPNDQKSLLHIMELYSNTKYPSILEFYGYNFFNLDNQPYPTLIFDYLPNSLKALLDKLTLIDPPSNFSRTNSYLILLGIALGMNFLHSKNITHNDLKPENIYLDSNYYPKITNYGLFPSTEESIITDVYSFSLIAFKLITEKKSEFDLSLIREDECKKFLEKCHSKSSTKSPTFYEICKFITTKVFINQFFNIEFDKVEDFFSNFNEEPNAYYFYGQILYEKGEKVEASQIYKKAADRGNADAMLSYGKMLLRGDSIQKNIDEATYYFKLASEKGKDVPIVETEKVEFEEKDEISIFKDKNQIVYKLSEKKQDSEIIESKNAKGQISIQSSINNDSKSYNITKIGFSSFFKNKEIISFESKSNSLKIIEPLSFYKCKNLRNFILKDALNVEIGSYCFAKSKNLQYINFNCNKIVIHENCFEGCTRLLGTLFQIKENLTIKSQAFKRCKNIEAFALKGNFDAIIGNECFLGDENLQTIGCFLNSIFFGKRVFKDCINLSRLTISTKQDLTISTNTFDDCNSIKEIMIECKSTAKLCDECFINKTELEHFSICSNNLIICNKCFTNCTSLEKFVVTESGNILIGENQFSNCNKLTKIEIKSNLNSKVEFGQNCFSGAENLSEVLICEGNVKIDKNCFYNCLSLQKLILNVQSIEIAKEQFINCNSLKEVYINSKSTVVLSSLGFSGVLSLTKICIFGQEEVNVGESCFQDCLSLSTVEFLDKQPIKKLNFDSQAFYKCEKLEEISLNAHELIVGEKCFNGTNLKKFEFDNEIITINDYSFHTLSSLEFVSIPYATKVSLNNNSFEDCKNIKNIVIGGCSNVFIGNHCFSGNSNLKLIELSAGDLHIGNSAFANCSSIEKLELKDIKKTYIGNNAFENCKLLKELLINNSNNDEINLKDFEYDLFLDNYCFVNDINLRSAQLNCKKLKIGDYCFSNCSNLSLVSSIDASEITYYKNSFQKTNKRLKLDFREKSMKRVFSSSEFLK